MERRLILGLSILILVLAFAIGAAVGMKAIHGPGEKALTQAADLALEGNFEAALPLARSAFDRWESFRSITAAFADHNPMDDTERLFRQMLVYAESEEIPHFAACCRELSAMLQAMYETHGFSLENIF